MKYTNKNNLPQPLVDFLTKDDYDAGDCDISVTSLISPARQRRLSIDNAEKLTEDVADLFYRGLGKAVHSMLEEAEKEAIPEERYYMKAEGLPGVIWTLSGKCDRLVLNKGLLQDYKCTSSYKFLDGKIAEEFEQQLNIYAHILRYNGVEIKKLQIVGMLRDWSLGNARRSKGYPKTSIVQVDIPMWPVEKCEEFIKERLIAHQSAEKSLPECTSAERWAREDTYAVMKKGQKKAVNGGIHSNLAVAEIHASKSKAFYVQHRPAISTRCENYCACKDFCKQYLKTKETK